MKIITNLFLLKILKVKVVQKKLKKKVDKVIADFRKRVTFKAKDHEYIVDGEKANFSASTLSQGLDEALKDPSDRKKFDTDWKLVSSRIGTIADTITRDFFNNTLKDSYANMTSEQLEDFKKDLKKLKSYFDKKIWKRELWNNYRGISHCC